MIKHDAGRLITVATLLCSFFWPAAGQTLPSYVETHIKDVDGPSNDDVVSRAYSDGLGKTLQTLTSFAGSGSYNCTVAGTDFDLAGRPTLTIKPFAYENSSSPLAFIASDLASIAGPMYYNGNNAPNAQGYPYSSKAYSGDPLGRTLTIGSPGLAYSADLTNGHQDSTWYFASPGPQNNLANFDYNGFIQTSTLYSGDLVTAIQGPTYTSP